MDATQIIIYLLTIVCNIPAVAAIRKRVAQTANDAFFARGRGSVVLLSILFFMEQIAQQALTGHVSALDSPQAFLELLKQTSALVVTAMAAHVGVGAAADSVRKLTR